MTRTVELEYETSMGIFDLDVTLKGEGNSKAEFIDPEVKSIECEGDITDLLIAATFNRAIVQDIQEKAWEKDRRTSGRGSCASWMHSLEEQEKYAPAIELFEKAEELREKIRNEEAEEEEEK